MNEQLEGPVQPDALESRPATYPCLTYHFYTGEIDSTFDIPPAAIEDWIQFNQGHSLLTKADKDTQYVDVENKTIIDRPECPAVLNGMVIENVPAPVIPQEAVEGVVEGVQMKTTALVQVNDKFPITSYEVDDDTIELDFPNPGHYKITLICFPYKRKVFEVTV